MDVKYAWNKIVKEQMEADPFKDLKGLSRIGPRGLSVKLPESRQSETSLGKGVNGGRI